MSILKDNTPPTPRPHERWRVAACALLLAVTALVLYRPWVDRPFDILDFSEFLPFLTGHEGVWARTAALTHYYVGEHARFNVVSYFALAVKWTLLGDSPVRWQLARALEMGIVVAGIYVLFRRLALRPFPALAAAALFVTSRMVGEAWFRMTMGEPLGLLFAVAALLLATTWRDHPREIWRAAIAGLLMAIAILAKEMLVGLLPLVWLIGVARGPDGRFGRPDTGAGSRRLLFWSALAPATAFGAVMLIALGGGSGGFTTLYGHTPVNAHRFIGLVTRPWIMEGDRGGFAAFRLPGNILFLLITGAGLLTGMKERERRAHLIGVVGAALALSCIFAVLYIPWPYTYLYYAVPFLLGTALLFGFALQALADEGRDGKRVAFGATLVLFAVIAPGVAQATSATIATQQVNGAIAVTLGQAPRATRIVVAKTAPPPQPWMGTGPTLRRYALAIGMARSLPPASDMGCREAGELLQQPLGGTIFVTYLSVCGGLQGSSVHIARSFRSIEVSWDRIGLRNDSIVADVLIGLEAMAPTSGSDTSAALPAPSH